jgi:hypothetical protein
MVWEFSSHFVIWLLVPAVGVWLARFPLGRGAWWRSVPAHVVATLPFSLVHTGGMIGLRQLAYALAGDRYDFGPFWTNWLYEYRKDCFVYSVVVAAVAAFRVYGLWLDARARGSDESASGGVALAGAFAGGASGGVPVTGAFAGGASGEVALAGVASAAGAATPVRAGSGAPGLPDTRDAAPSPLGKLVVRRRNREFILDSTEIDRLEADGNYVMVHAGGESYRLRDSLESVARRLGELRFARVHRAHVVNIDRIREVQPWDNGDYRILLKDGSFVNFSRRYRSRLSHLFG